MNKGTTRHPRYFCDKCETEIRYTYKKGFVGLYTYASREKTQYLRKNLTCVAIVKSNLKFG